jgi:hypothetical protein
LQLLLNDYSVHSDGADFAPLPSDSDWSSPEVSRCASEAGSVFGSSVASLDLSRSEASPAASLSRASSLSKASSSSRHKPADKAGRESHLMVSSTAMGGSARGAGPLGAGDARGKGAAGKGPAATEARPLPGPRGSSRSLSQLGSASGSGQEEPEARPRASARLRSRVEL